MTIDEKIAVMQAFKEGKEIEFRQLGTPDVFVNCTHPFWNFGTFEYRVKPEPEPPKYEPFSFEDDLVGKVVTDGEIEAMITVKARNVVYIDKFYHYADLLENWKFLNGSPCGKIIEK